MPAAKYAYRNKETGEVFEGDEFGNKIRVITPGTIKPKTETPANQAPSWKEGFRQNFGQYIPDAITTGVGLLGTVAGLNPILGGIAGTTAGSLTGQTLQIADPELFGQGPKNTTEMLFSAAKDSAINSAFDLAGGAIPLAFSKTARREAIDKILPHIFPPSKTIPQEVLQPNVYGPKVEFTTGQTNRFAKFMEDWFAHEPKAVREMEQKRSISDWFKKQHYPTETLVQTGQANAAANAQNLYAKRTNAYDALIPERIKNTKNVAIEEKKISNIIDPTTGQPIVNTTYRNVPVEGAIPVVQSKAFADKAGARIDDILGPDDINSASLGSGLGYDLIQIRKELDKVRKINTHLDPVTHQPMANPIESYEKLKSIADNIEKSISGNRLGQVKDQLQTTLESFVSTLRQDIDNGITGWGSKAQKLHEAAKKSHIDVVTKLRPDLAQDLLKAGKDPQTTYMQIAREYMSDPQMARQFLAASGDKATAKQLLLSNMADNAFDNTTGLFSPKKALDFLHNYKEVANEALTPSHRTNLTIFLRKAEKIGDISENAGTALSLTKGRAGVSLAANAIKIAGAGLAGYGAYSGSNTALYPGGIILGAAAGRRFAKNVLLDPEYAKVASGLLGARAASPRSQKAAQLILGGLKGEQVYLMSKDNKPVPAVINDDGEVQPLR